MPPFTCGLGCVTHCHVTDCPTVCNVTDRGQDVCDHVKELEEFKREKMTLLMPVA